jgi:hypothetical protein
MTYLSEDALPSGVRPIAFPWRAPSAGTPGEKHAIECGCGATIIMEPLPRAVSGNGQPATKPAPAPAAGSRLTEPKPSIPSPPAPIARANAKPGRERSSAPAAVTKPPPPAKADAPAKPASTRPATPIKTDAGKPAPAVQIESIKPAPLPAPAKAPKPAASRFPKPQPVARQPEPRLDEREPTADPRQTVMVDSTSAQAVMAPPRSASTAAESQSAAVAEIEPPPPVPETDVVMCGICQSRIDPSEQMTACPKCALTFHADCWTENRGCAAYGCSQVGVLEPPDATPMKELDAAELAEPFPWEFLLLGASVISAVAGALAFGIPSAFLAIVTLAAAARKGLRRWPLLASTAALCVAGLLVGVEFSRFWWLGIRPFQWVGP